MLAKRAQRDSKHVRRLVMPTTSVGMAPCSRRAIVLIVTIVPIVTVGDRSPAPAGRNVDRSVELSPGRGRIYDVFIVE